MVLLLLFFINFNPILVLFKHVTKYDNKLIVTVFQSYISLIQAYILLYVFHFLPGFQSYISLIQAYSCYFIFTKFTFQSYISLIQAQL